MNVGFYLKHLLFFYVMCDENVRKILRNIILSGYDKRHVSLCFGHLVISSSNKMEGINLGLIYITIALFLQIKDSSSGGHSSKKKINLNTKFEHIDDNYYKYPPDREKFLLHRERDVRILEAELNEALEVRRRLMPNARAEVIVNSLIEHLKLKELSAIRDFHEVYKKERNPHRIGRYTPGLMTARAKEHLRDISAEREWDIAYNDYKCSTASSSQASSSLASPSRAFSDPFSFFETHKSIDKPDADYVLGPRDKYLKNEKGKSQKYAERAIKIRKKSRNLHGKGDDRDPAAAILDAHATWLDEKSQQLEREYNKVLNFEELPRLTEKHILHTDDNERLKEEMRRAGVPWGD